MPDRLILRLDRTGGLTWLRQSPDGRMLSSSQNGVPPASVRASTSEVVVLVPSEQVLLLEARVNARNSIQLLQAVPYAVEDQLLGAVEDQHFAIQPGADGKVGLAVVARSTMRSWIGVLDAAGIRADILVPESIAVPISPDSATVMIDAGRVITRLDPWSAMTCDVGRFADWLAQARAAGIDRAIEVLDFGAGPPLELAGPIAAYHAGQTDPLAYLARNLRLGGINLLSGEFSSAHRQVRGTRWWRRTLGLAAAVVVMAFVHRGLEVSRLSRAVDRVDAAMIESLAKTFPDLAAAERARAPQSVMRDRLERLRGGSESSGMLRMLGQIAPLIGRTTRSQLRGFEFRNGILEVGLRSPDVATLDSLREQFSAIPGLSAEVTASIPADSGVDGRIRVRGGTP